MKKLLQVITSVFISFALLCALPHAFASGVNPILRNRLERLSELCTYAHNDTFTPVGNSSDLLDSAQAIVDGALKSGSLTDKTAVEAVFQAQSLLLDVELTSEYGLSVTLEHMLEPALFKNEYIRQIERVKDYAEDADSYRELFYHYQDGALDWVLVHTVDSASQPCKSYAVLGDRLLRCQCGDLPFPFGYGVYDAAIGRFLPLANAYQLYEHGGFRGLEQALSKLQIGELTGDLDRDGMLTVKDATVLQRCLAELESYPPDEAVEGFDYFNSYLGNRPTYLSDLNRNGKSDIGDVTALQRRLAEFK